MYRQFNIQQFYVLPTQLFVFMYGCAVQAIPFSMPISFTSLSTSLAKRWLRV